MKEKNVHKWKEKGNLAARWIYHICIAAYLLILLLERYQSVLSVKVGLFYLDGSSKSWICFVLTALLIEKIVRLKWKALPSVLLALTAWAVDGGLLGLCLFLAVSDLAVERRTLRMLLWFDIAAVFVTLLLLWTGQTKDIIIDFGYGLGHTFGFAHSNFPGGMVLAAALLVWVLYLLERPMLSFLLFWGGAALSWFVFACRTATAMLVLFPLLYLFMKSSRGQGRKAVGWLSQAMPFLCMGATVFMVMSILNGWIDWNRLSLSPSMMQRFSFAASEIRSKGISWFRPDFSTSLPIDSQYMYTLLYGGVLACVLLLSVMLICARVAVKRDRMDIAAVTVLFSIYGLMESAPTILLWNFVPFVLLGLRKEPSPKRIRWPKMTLKVKCAASVGIALLCFLLAMIMPDRSEVPEKILTPEFPHHTAGTLIGAEYREKQTFISDEPFTGIQVLMATYHFAPIGTVKAKLADADGKILDETLLNGLNIYDNQYVSIPLGKEYPAGRYSLTIGEGKILWGKAAVWRNDENPFPDGSLWIDGQETGSDWNMRLYNGATSGRSVLKRECLILGVILIIGVWMIPDLKRKSRDDVLPLYMD